MENADVIAKNLLENKICTSCKYFQPTDNKCMRFEPLKLSSTDDIEVYVNGLLYEQNEGYVITDKTLLVLQHHFDNNMANSTVTGYNVQGNMINPTETVTVKERYIEDGKIVKINHKLGYGRNIPHEQTCEGYLNNKDMINYRS